MAANKPLVSNYEAEEVFEEGDAPKEAQTVHRIRANSTIMQLNKILGKCVSRKPARVGLRTTFSIWRCSSEARSPMPAPRRTGPKSQS